MWWDSQKHPESPPFTGGVLDAWPARYVDGFGVASEEYRRIQLFLAGERARSQRRRGKHA